MKKYIFTCFAAIIACIVLQAQLVVQSGSSIVTQAGTTLYVDGLTLTPAADFTLTSSISRTATISNPNPDPDIARVYQFANTTNPYSGTIRVHYQDAELNGLQEQNLVVSAYNSSMWQRFGAASSDATANYVLSNALSSVPLKEVTLVNPATILPLTFLNAAAYRRNGSVQVDWKVGDQTNTQAYEVERSTDGIQFTKLYTVAALRMVAIGYTYNWLDPSAPSSTIYYRIKSIGLRGDNTYSSILKVSPINTPGSIGIWPNPLVGNMLNLQLINQEAGRYTIRIISISGQIVYTTIVAHAGGSSYQQLRLPNISKGTYQLQIEKPDHSQEVKAFISQ